MFLCVVLFCLFCFVASSTLTTVFHGVFSFVFSPSFKEFCFIYLVCVGVCVFMRRVVLFVLLRGFLHIDDSFSRCRNRSFENWNELKSLGAWA